MAAFLLLGVQSNSSLYRPTSTVPATIPLSVVTDASVASGPTVSASTSGYISEHPAYGKYSTTVFALGDYIIGDTDDNMISGHPDIRY